MSRDHLAPVPDAPGYEVATEAEIVPDVAFSHLPSRMWDSPAHFTEDFRRLYDSLLDSLRRDAQHLPGGTMVSMQIERLAFYYVSLRQFEANGGVTARERDAVYKRYRDAANDVAALATSKKLAPEELHQIVSQHTAKIVANVLRTLPAEHAKPLYKRFARALDEGTSA